MRNVNLEENELTITAIFQQHTKEETIQTLKEALEVFVNMFDTNPEAIDSFMKLFSKN